jgi:hypothetical protein
MNAAVPVWFFFALDGALTLMLLLTLWWPVALILAAAAWILSWKVGLL